MSLFYKQEHTTCYNYTLPTSATFKIIKFTPSKTPQIIDVDRSVIIFLLEGEILVTYNNYKNRVHKKGQMTLLPRNSSCYARIVKDCTILSCSFVQNIDFCNQFSLADLMRFIPKKYTYNFEMLPIKETMNQFIELLKTCLNDGINCVHFHELMKKELFILFRAYYSKEELATFFYPLLGKDLDFKDFVLTNYLSIDDLQEFAQQANLSIDTFKRRFKEAFGESAHKWITQRKSEFIYRDLIATDKSFADIASEYKMSSQAYLSTFCKRHFGKSPQELRDRSF